jgi:hypothetical protein
VVEVAQGSSDADRLRLRLAELAADRTVLDAAVDGARAHSAAVAALPRAETERHTAELISSALRAFAGARPLSRTELAAAARFGADRAEQGVPLASLLDGFQAGRAEAIRLAIAHVRAAGVPAETLLDGVVELDGLIAGLEHQLTHAHHRTELDRLRTAREERVLVLRHLLLGTARPDDVDLGSVGLGQGTRYHCLVTAEHEPGAAHRLESRLAASAGGGYGLLDGYLVGVAARLPSSASARGTLVVAGAAVELADLPGSFRMCCDARDAGVRAGQRGLVEVSDLAVDSAFDAVPELGRALAERLLSALRPGTPFHQELVVTALAHLDNGGRLAVTAAALHVHPNTVKYRLRRLRELTGFTTEGDGPGGSLRHAVHWWWALRTWQRGVRVDI